MEPELIYSIDNKTDIDSLRLLFYPDTNGVLFNIKLKSFINNIFNKKRIRGVDYIELIKDALEKEDYFRAKSIVEKYLQRFESEIAI